MAIIIIALFIGGIVVVSGIGAAFYFLGKIVTDPTDDEFAKVRIGMTTAQVVAVMGDSTPKVQQDNDGTTAFLYPILEGTASDIVVFKNGVVVSKSADLQTSQTNLLAAPSATGPSADTTPATMPGAF
jgi:hypothetical protein